MARLDIEEYKSKWEGMEEGQQINVDHSNCPSGVDTRQRLYLKKVAGKILGYCHHCGNSAVISTKGKGSYKSVNKLLEMDKEVKADKGKRTLPLDAKHVFNMDTLVPWLNQAKGDWFNDLAGKGAGHIASDESISMILVYLYRCGFLMPGNLSMPPLPMTSLHPSPDYKDLLDKIYRYHEVNHSSLRFLSHNPLMRRFWEELKYSPSQVRLFIPYWNFTPIGHAATTEAYHTPPSGYMGRDVMIDAEPGTKRIKWLKYPLEHGKAANAYYWEHVRPQTGEPQRWLQIYVEDLISQLRIVQALNRAFPTGDTLHSPNPINTHIPSLDTAVEIDQYEILRQLDGIRIICCQGTSLNDDVKAAATAPHVLYARGTTLGLQTEARFAAPWMDLDTAGRQCALKLMVLPLPGSCSSSHIIIQDEPKNGTDSAIIEAIASVLPSQKGWV